MPCPKGIQSVTQPRANVYICSQNWRCAQLHGLCDWIMLSRNATREVHSSLLVTSILCDHILSQDHKYDYEIIANQLEAKALVCQENNVLRCWTPMPRRTDTLNSRPAIERMSGWRSVCMNKELEKLNMPHSPPCISATGDLANKASTFYKRLASLLASKWDHPYSSTLCWLHSSRAFSILRSAIQSTRGVQSSSGHAIRIPTMVDLINVESNISPAV